MNGQLCSAIVDTGSDVTLLKRSTVYQLRLGIDKSRVIPGLVSVNGSQLQQLGMTKINLHVGDQRILTRWVPVVPDSYLNRDMLLGCDVLGTADLTWKKRRRIIVWGGHTYDVAHIRTPVGHIRAVKKLSSPSPTLENAVQLKEYARLQPYQSKIVHVAVKAEPNANLIVTTQSKFAEQPSAMLVTVSAKKTIPVVIDNRTKVRRILKPGTIIAFFELYDGEIESCQSVRHTRIENELLPKTPEREPGETRREQLSRIIEHQEWSHLNPTQREVLRSLVLSHEQLFVLSSAELGALKGAPVHINVENKTPCRTPQYRYPENAKQIISNMLGEMQDKGIIEPSNAAWLSPIVLVNKPNGSKRMCLDFRRVNQHLAADIHPLPRLDDLVNTASGHKFYATLDLKDAYFQITLDEESRDLTTFSDGVTLYRFCRLPFGLSCAPAIFTRKIVEILTPLLKKGWMRNYLDDLILFANTYEELVERLEQTFQLLEGCGIKLNLDKCELVKTKVKFLGHIVSESGSQPDPKNVQAIDEMEPPKKVKEVRRFVGMASFYRKYVPNFSQLVSPLTALTKNNIPFQWSDECQQAFVTVKAKLKQSPTLVKYCPELPLTLVTDASDDCVGGVLHQTQPNGDVNPLGYFSKKLTKSECNYSVTDKEALGIVLACRHFHHFLWGHRFEVQTDHQPLTAIFRTKTKCPRVTRWCLEMREYNFDIKYLKGKHNVVADQLSRPVRYLTYEPEEKMLGISKDELVQRQRSEPVWAELVEFLKGGRLPQKKIPGNVLSQFELKDELLYYVRNVHDQSVKFCLVVPRSLVKVALSQIHDDKGHFGRFKTIKAAENLYYWPSLRIDCIEYLNQCHSCTQFKAPSGLNQVYQELPPVNTPLKRIAIDLTDMHQGHDGNRYILTIIDHFSRFVKFFPLRNKCATSIIERLEKYVGDFGDPEAILLDNALEFTGSEMRKWADQKNITLHYTTPYHPQGNAIIERMHRTLKTVLAQLCGGYPLCWPTLLRKCQTMMNEAVHSATGVTPYYAFYGRHPYRGSSQMPHIENDDQDSVALREVIKNASLKSQRHYRAVANRKRKKEVVGKKALVWVRSEKTIPGTCTKLNPKWIGPYRVVEVLNEGVAYVVENVFTGQQLQRAAEKIRPYVGESDVIPQMEEVIVDLAGEGESEEQLPPRTRRAPRRLISEC